MGEALLESAQALLTGYDTAVSKQWREEDRRWRQEDLQWRARESEHMATDKEYLEETRRWRGQDIEQRVLDNARCMWARFVEKNRRAVEERAEQLKSISNLAALIAGFALIAFLEFSVDVQSTPAALVMSFGLTTALTVGLMVISMVTCSLMHASILKTGKRYVSEEDEADFIFRCRQYAKGYRLGDRPPTPARSFEVHWEHRCEGSWRRAFYLFSAGIPAFLSNLALAGWIKFIDARATAIVISVIMGASLIVFLVTYYLWASHLVGKEVDLFKGSFPHSPAGLPFDWHLIPVRNKFLYLNTHERSSPLTSPLHNLLRPDIELGLGNLDSIKEEDDSSASTSQGTSSRSENGQHTAFEIGQPGAAGNQQFGGGNISQVWRRHASEGSIGVSATDDDHPLNVRSSADLILGDYRRSSAQTSLGGDATSLPAKIYNSIVRTVFGSPSQSNQGSDLHT